MADGECQAREKFELIEVRRSLDGIWVSLIRGRDRGCCSLVEILLERRTTDWKMKLVTSYRSQ